MEPPVCNTFLMVRRLKTVTRLCIDFDRVKIMMDLQPFAKLKGSSSRKEI